MKSKFKIQGLDCANCAARLEREIQEVDGVESVNINFMTEKMVIEYDENNGEELIKKIIKFIRKEEPDVTLTEIKKKVGK